MRMEIHSTDQNELRSENAKPSQTTRVITVNICRFIQQCGSSFLFCLKVTSLALFLIYAAIPIFVRANQWILPKIVFSNIVHWPPFINLSLPSDFGLNNTRNFYLHVEDRVDIGAWHILPADLQNKRGYIPWKSFESELDNGHNIFLYLHGNSGSRGSHHRVQLYKLLSKLNFHVISIDYRGYGDSSGDPTENGVVADAYFTYKWLKERIGKSKMFIWGHSLGTGVTTKLAKRLCDEGDQPAGIVLESPFNNIQEAAKNHPLGLPYRMLPWFEWIFVDGIREHGIFFSSDESILSVTSNIMILHAKDDYIVPFDLGRKLYHKAKDTRTQKTGNVQFVAFEAHLGYGHKLIYKAPELPDLIRKFVGQ
uniref:AB hydrolase-1 domain-containing protein n=1 Tax=Arion vulgaris TaxID=1028688 RepID=A0A0B7B861_9EUPU